VCGSGSRLPEWLSSGRIVNPKKESIMFNDFDDYPVDLMGGVVDDVYGDDFEYFDDNPAEDPFVDADLHNTRLEEAIDDLQIATNSFRRAGGSLENAIRIVEEEF